MFPYETATKSGRTLTIREAQASDAADLIAYINEVAGESDFLTFGPGDFTKTIEEEERILQAHADAPNQVFLIGELEGAIAGTLNVSAGSKPRIRHIGDLGMSVRKEHWNDGIGSALLSASIEWARRTGVVRKLNLHVYTHNEAAIGLYERSGFEHEGTIRRDAYIDGEFADSYAMGLLIDS